MTVDLLPAPWLNQQLADGRYLILDLLGDGGMSHVYRAWDRRLRRDVAIKALKAVLLTDPTLAFRFQREISIVAGLQHAHILPVLDSGKHQGMPFAVFPYMAGGNLADRLRDTNAAKTGWLTAEALRWLVQIASALDFLHSRKLYHRDVKPDNILFDAEGTAFLSDFGVVRVMEPDDSNANPTSVTGPNMVLGTCAYMAPELISGQTDYNGSVDQYSLAVTLFEALTGERPFKGTPQTIMLQHLQADPKPLQELWPDAPLSLSQALLVALSKDPSQRFPSCTAFARVVVASVSDDSTDPIVPNTKSPTDEHSTVATLTPREITGHKPWLWRFAVLAMLFIVGGMAGAMGAWWSQSEDDPNLPVAQPPPKPKPPPVKPPTPKELTVSQDGFGDYQSVSEAIANSGDGTQITVMPGTYRESVVLDRNVTIIGNEGKQQLPIVIESNNRHCITMKTSKGSIRGLKLRCVAADDEKKFHALYVPQGEISVIDCDIQSTSHASVAIHGPSANVHLKNCRIHGASQSVGLYIHQSGSATIEACSIFANEVSGVTIVQGGKLTFRDCEISNNVGHGVIVRQQANALFEDCRIHSNGNINVRIDQTGNPTFRNCQIYGGSDLGIFVDGETKGLFEDCRIYENAKAGVSAQENADPTFKRCTISKGKSQGIFVYKGGLGTFEDCEISNNLGVGVEVNWDKSNPTLRNCKILSGAKHGVEVALRGLGTFYNCTVAGNQKANAWIRADGNPEFQQCKFTDSKTDHSIHIQNAGGAFLGCTIRDNESAGKAGVYFEKGKSGLTCSFRKCKINSNSIGVITQDDGAGLAITECDLTNNTVATRFPKNHKVRYSGNTE